MSDNDAKGAIVNHFNSLPKPNAYEQEEKSTTTLVMPIGLGGANKAIENGGILLGAKPGRPINFEGELQRVASDGDMGQVLSRNVSLEAPAAPKFLAGSWLFGGLLQYLDEGTAPIDLNPDFNPDTRVGLKPVWNGKKWVRPDVDVPDIQDRYQVDFGTMASNAPVSAAKFVLGIMAGIGDIATAGVGAVANEAVGLGATAFGAGMGGIAHAAEFIGFDELASEFFPGPEAVDLWKEEIQKNLIQANIGGMGTLGNVASGMAEHLAVSLGMHGFDAQWKQAVEDPFAVAADIAMVASLGTIGARGFSRGASAGFKSPFATPEAPGYVYTTRATLERLKLGEASTAELMRSAAGDSVNILKEFTVGAERNAEAAGIFVGKLARRPDQLAGAAAGVGLLTAGAGVVGAGLGAFLTPAFLHGAKNGAIRGYYSLMPVDAKRFRSEMFDSLTSYVDLGEFNQEFSLGTATLNPVDEAIYRIRTNEKVAIERINHSDLELKAGPRVLSPALNTVDALDGPTLPGATNLIERQAHEKRHLELRESIESRVREAEIAGAENVPEIDIHVTEAIQDINTAYDGMPDFTDLSARILPKDALETLTQWESYLGPASHGYFRKLKEVSAEGYASDANAGFFPATAPLGTENIPMPKGLRRVMQREIARASMKTTTLVRPRKTNRKVAKKGSKKVIPPEELRTKGKRGRNIDPGPHGGVDQLLNDHGYVTPKDRKGLIKRIQRGVTRDIDPEFIRQFSSLLYRDVKFRLDSHYKSRGDVMSLMGAKGLFEAKKALEQEVLLGSENPNRAARAAEELKTLQQLEAEHLHLSPEYTQTAVHALNDANLRRSIRRAGWKWAMDHNPNLGVTDQYVISKANGLPYVFHTSVLEQLGEFEGRRITASDKLSIRSQTIRRIKEKGKDYKVQSQTIEDLRLLADIVYDRRAAGKNAPEFLKAELSEVRELLRSAKSKRNTARSKLKSATAGRVEAGKVIRDLEDEIFVLIGREAELKHRLQNPRKLPPRINKSLGILLNDLIDTEGLAFSKMEGEATRLEKPFDPVQSTKDAKAAKKLSESDPIEFLRKYGTDEDASGLTSYLHNELSLIMDNDHLMNVVYDQMIRKYPFLREQNPAAKMNLTPGEHSRLWAGSKAVWGTITNPLKSFPAIVRGPFKRTVTAYGAYHSSFMSKKYGALGVVGKDRMLLADLKNIEAGKDTVGDVLARVEAAGGDAKKIFDVETAITRILLEVDPASKSFDALYRAAPPSVRHKFEAVRNLFDDILKKVNDARQLAGLPLINRRTGYLPHLTRDIIKGLEDMGEDVRPKKPGETRKLDSIDERLMGDLEKMIESGERHLSRLPAKQNAFFEYVREMSIDEVRGAVSLNDIIDAYLDVAAKQIAWADEIKHVKKQVAQYKKDGFGAHAWLLETLTLNELGFPSAMNKAFNYVSEGIDSMVNTSMKFALNPISSKDVYEGGGTALGTFIAARERGKFWQLPVKQRREMRRSAHRISNSINRQVSRAILGASVSSAMKNFGDLSRVAGESGIAKMYEGAFGTPELKAALELDGVEGPASGIGQGMAAMRATLFRDSSVPMLTQSGVLEQYFPAAHAFVDASRKQKWFDVFAMGAFTSTEMINRGVAFNTGIVMGLERGLTPAQAIASGAEFSEKVNFKYDSPYVSPFFKNPLVSGMGSFTKYGLRFFDFALSKYAEQTDSAGNLFKAFYKDLKKSGEWKYSAVALNQLMESWRFFALAGSLVAVGDPETFWNNFIGAGSDAGIRPAVFGIAGALTAKNRGSEARYMLGAAGKGAAGYALGSVIESGLPEYKDIDIGTTDGGMGVGFANGEIMVNVPAALPKDMVEPWLMKHTKTGRYIARNKLSESEMGEFEPVSLSDEWHMPYQSLPRELRVSLTHLSLNMDLNSFMFSNTISPDGQRALRDGGLSDFAASNFSSPQLQWLGNMAALWTDRNNVSKEQGRRIVDAQSSSLPSSAREFGKTMGIASQMMQPDDYDYATDIDEGLTGLFMEPFIRRPDAMSKNPIERFTARLAASIPNWAGGIPLRGVNDASKALMATFGAMNDRGDEVLEGLQPHSRSTGLNYASGVIEGDRLSLQYLTGIKPAELNHYRNAMIQRRFGNETANVKLKYYSDMLTQSMRSQDLRGTNRAMSSMVHMFSNLEISEDQFKEAMKTSGVVSSGALSSEQYEFFKASNLSRMRSILGGDWNDYRPDSLRVKDTGTEERAAPSLRDRLKGTSGTGRP